MLAGVSPKVRKIEYLETEEPPGMDAYGPNPQEQSEIVFKFYSKSGRLFYFPSRARFLCLPWILLLLH